MKTGFTIKKTLPERMKMRMYCEILAINFTHPQYLHSLKKAISADVGGGVGGLAFNMIQLNMIHLMI